MTRLRTLIAALVFANLIGCKFTPVPPGGGKEGAVGAVDDATAKYVLFLGIERTGEAAADDRTFAACDKMLKELRVERAGEQDKIVLVDLSGPGIVDTVDPRIFREKYKGGLKAAIKPPTGGSRVYKVLADALLHTRLRHLKKEEGKAAPKASLVVFSRLKDTRSGDRADGRLLYEVGAFDNVGGHGAFYGMDQGEALRWTQAFQDSLRGRWHISTGPEADDIRLPRFGND